VTDQKTRLNDGEGLEIAHPEDFGISRDEHGEVQPVAQRIPGTDMAVRVKPMVGGAYEHWGDVVESDEADDERVDEFLREFIVEGIGSNGLDEVPDYVVPGLVQAIRNSAGHEVFRAVEEQQTRENLAALTGMEGSEEMLENLMGEYMRQQMDEDENGDSETQAES